MERSVADLCQPISPARGLDDGRIVSGLEEPLGILLPPVRADPLLPFKDPAGAGGNCSNCSVLAQPVLVPIIVGASDGRPTSSFSPQVVADIPVGGVSSADQGQLNSTDRLAALRSCLGERGLSPKVIELVLGAARSNTHSAYQSAWVAWNSWCLKRNFDPLSVGVNEVLSFLSDYFDSGKSYSTVNVARSMLSSTLGMTKDNLEVGKNPLVSRLMKGIYNKKPPAPKYDSTWDPSIVLSYMISTAQSSLSILQLSRKTATLLALTSLSRCADLASIQLQSISFTDLDVSFVLSRPRKAQHSGPLHKLTIGVWRQNPAICPVNCLKLYINQTASMRRDSNKDLLFVGSNKPHNPVSSSKIGRWVKDQLKVAGIDTDKFSAHSVRGAAASKAAANGLPIQSILNQGHWARESTFARFYKRSVISSPSDSVGHSILQGSNTPAEN